MWEREAYVMMKTGEGAPPTKIEGLDIKFTIRKNCYFISDARIEILNPTRELQKQYFSHIGMLNEDTDNQRPIELYAGYKDGKGGAQKIFSGKVFSAFPSIPPDVWLSMECMSRFCTREDIITTSSGSVRGSKIVPIDSQSGSISISDVINQIKTALNTTKPKGETDEYQIILDGNGSSPAFSTKVISFSRAGTARELLKEIHNLHPDLQVAIINDKTVKVFDRTLKHEVVEKPICAENGMIGLPRMNWPTVFVETMMRPDIDIYKDVELKVGGTKFDKVSGKDMQFINGTYRVMSITYQGQLRDGRFSMLLELLVLNEAMKSVRSRKESKIEITN